MNYPQARIVAVVPPPEFDSRVVCGLIAQIALSPDAVFGLNGVRVLHPAPHCRSREVRLPAWRDGAGAGRWKPSVSLPPAASEALREAALAAAEKYSPSDRSL
jgi:hypothetical protein